MSVLRCLVGTMLAVVTAPTSCLETIPPAPPVSKEQGPREFLLAATVEQMVFAHADYPAGTTSDQAESGAVLPVKVMALAVNPNGGERKKLHTLFAGPLQHIPVSDGRWIAVVDAAGAVSLADITDLTVRQLPLGTSGQIELWALHHPWMIARDAGGPFVYHLTTQERIDLPSGAKSSPLALDEGHVGFLVAAPGSADSDPVDIRVLDLSSRQSTVVASAADPQIFLEPGQLTYIVHDEAEDVHVVRSHVLETGVSTIRLKLRVRPNPNETQYIADVASRGYLVVSRSPNELGHTYEQLFTLRRSGEFEFMHGYVPAMESPAGQPRLVGPYLVFADLRDGAWTISNLEVLSSSRAFLFQNME